MVSFIRKRLLVRPIFRKGLVTFIILCTYILGTHVALPGASQAQLPTSSFLSQVNQLVAGRLATVHVFTLGLGPYMSSMILWKLVTLRRAQAMSKMTQTRQNAFKMGLSLGIGLIQGLHLVFTLQPIRLPHMSEWLGRSMVILVLLAGMCLVIWLCQMNMLYGIGGMSVIIVFNVLTHVLTQVYELWQAHAYMSVGIVLGLISVVIVICVLMDRGEYRIRFNRVGIESEYQEQSYLPIKVNPSGGLAIMYALSLFALPQYLAQIVAYSFKDNTLLHWIAQHMTVTHVFGLSVYVVVIGYLTLGFGFFHVDPHDIAELFQKNGDYIDGVKPGKETRAYVSRLVGRLSFFSALYMSILAGGPLWYGILTQTFSPLYYLPGSVMLLTGLLLQVCDELNVLRLEHAYDTIIAKAIIHQERG